MPLLLLLPKKHLLLPRMLQPLHQPKMPMPISVRLAGRKMDFNPLHR